MKTSPATLGRGLLPSLTMALVLMLPMSSGVFAAPPQNMTGKPSTVASTDTPTGVETFSVRMTVNGDPSGNALGPFQVNVICRNGDRHVFEMYDGDTKTFQYNANQHMRCRITETLNPITQRPFFKIRPGDTQGISTGVLDGNSTALAGKELSVTNTYYTQGVHTITISKVVAGGPVPRELSSFDIKVQCRTDRTGIEEHAFDLADAESADFQVEKDQRTYCRAVETLTAKQKPYFKTLLEDNQGASSGTLLYPANTAPTDAGSLTVTSTYRPTGVNSFNVAMYGSRSPMDSDEAPFTAIIACANGESYNFELEPGEVSQFQYETGTVISCQISGTLSGTQTGRYTLKKGDTFGTADGIMQGQSSLAVASQGNACGEHLPAGSFCLKPIPIQDTDQDGLSDVEEAALGTDPNNPDTNDNGILDGAEGNLDPNVTRTSTGIGIDSGTHTVSITPDGGEDPLIPVQPDNVRAITTATNAPTLQVRAFLQGPYDGNLHQMKDALRSKGILPVKQPYSEAPIRYPGTETLNLDLVMIEGDNAVVDWALVELRDATAPAKIIRTLAVLIQRDGDLIDPQTGSQTLELTGLASHAYYVGLRHRNHLGVMSAEPVLLSETPTQIDFTQITTPTYGKHARMETRGVALLWAGDTHHRQQVIANGPGNGPGVVLGTILSHTSNEQINSNYQLEGYYNSDLNMDGKTIYAGPNNDVNLLLGNVLLHPENEKFLANYMMNGALPK